MPRQTASRTPRATRSLTFAVSLALALGQVGVPLSASAQSAVPAGTRVVQPGETLWQIATDAGTDVATLVSLNGLANGDAIIAGQSLTLSPGGAPAGPPPPVAPATSTYTVVEGDTLSLIASRVGTTPAGLVELNGIENPDQVRVGAVLKLPDGAMPPAAPSAPPTAAPAPAPAPSSPAPGSSRKSLLTPYTVQPGETLGTIARQFGIAVDIIAQASGVADPNLVRAGSVLQVPLPGRERVVNKGETLSAIAAAERVDLGTLVDFNSLADPGRIREGDVLVIPGAPGPRQQSAAAATPTVQPANASPAPTPTPAAPASQPVAAPAPGAPPASATPTARATAGAPVPAVLPTDGMVGGAKKLVGRPYVFGGSGPGSFDCSGLIWYVAKQIGKPLPRGLRGQYDSGPHPAKEDLKPGDLVFFQNTYMPGLSHNGVYIGNGQFVNAGDEKSGVVVSSLSAEYWASRYFGATRPG